MIIIDLLTHIRSLNVALTESAGEGGFAMGWHEDIALWNERGIHTPSDLDHYALVASACDLSIVP